MWKCHSLTLILKHTENQGGNELTDVNRPIVCRQREERRSDLLLPMSDETEKYGETDVVFLLMMRETELFICQSKNPTPHRLCSNWCHNLQLGPVCFGQYADATTVHLHPPILVWGCGHFWATTWPTWITGPQNCWPQLVGWVLQQNRH